MDKLVGKVIAVSEPTFPYEGPVTPPIPNPDPSTDKADIKLTAGTSTLQVGATTTCDINIQSSEREVKSYSIKITFDPNTLEVVDSITSQTGTQVNFLDQFSVTSVNSADNLNGTITLTASISGSAQTINRRIAQIKFRAKRTGTSVVSITKSQSTVLSDDGENVIGSTTSANYTITGQTSSYPSTLPTTTTSSPANLPQSGIFDSLAALGSIFAGLLMLFTGIKTISEKRKPKDFDS
ncbi:MAG: cohesin domain-containing protein [Candidatus Dojkabacteria bacterium]|jgi:K+/H+ antiporter YhaU regulatory subunit KhtT|nr:cohesin domain-containing protein [Candidatus Dojkabacteria bacterium]